MDWDPDQAWDRALADDAVIDALCAQFVARLRRLKAEYAARGETVDMGDTAHRIFTAAVEQVGPAEVAAFTLRAQEEMDMQTDGGESGPPRDSAP